ncbi:MAG: UDP-N-acetylglucosamine 2-epimerase (non-hydrolyzing) [Rickettsia endosymbiont of Bryobia graminum]|nr:UDP-N-acetylglucosamine 2-epimerase (non-hydrolyzing) [Rickettsia endosymbiont of Bryobia graminum]
MKRILTVFGNRPQFIKSATISKKLVEFGCDETIVNTGQHFDTKMSDSFFKELNLKTPDYNLNINNLSDLQFISTCIAALENIFLKEQPHIVLVYGDTNTTLSAAIAAKKLNIKIAHIEAGPRLGDITIPEEYNRILVDNSSDILFAPDITSVQNLKKEGFTEDKIVFSGDVMLDLFMEKQLSFIKSEYAKRFDRYFVCTFHRQENVDTQANLSNLCDMLISLEEHIVYPIHPRTRNNLLKYNLYKKLVNHPKIHLEEPLSYLEMMGLISDSNLVLTDSGGLQKEAFFAGIPCYVFLNTTPWPEIENTGSQKVMGSFTSSNFSSYKFQLTDFDKVVKENSIGKSRLKIFGGGKASIVIAKTLQSMNI